MKFLKKILWSIITIGSLSLLVIIFKEDILKKEVYLLSQKTQNAQQKIESLLKIKNMYEERITLSNKLKNDRFLEDMPSSFVLRASFESAVKKNYFTSAHLEVQPTQHIDCLDKKIIRMVVQAPLDQDIYKFITHIQKGISGKMTITFFSLFAAQKGGHVTAEIVCDLFTYKAQKLSPGVSEH